MSNETYRSLDRGQKLTVWAIAGFLVVGTAVSTVVHLGYPEVLDVPSNQGVAYTSYGVMFLLDLFPIAMAALCLQHAWRRLGPYRAMVFLGGSFVFTGVEESMWILLGRYQHQIQAWVESHGLPVMEAGQMAAERVAGTYYFTRGFFWFIETPILACLGWFFVAYSCVYVAGIILPRARLFTRALAGGLIAMNLDLWLDPVQTHPDFKSWIWLSQDVINIFSIPLSNFIGWFLLIFLFAIVFEWLPAMVKRWGPVKAALYFYGLLMVLEFMILGFFASYGLALLEFIPEPINLTIGGI